MMRDTNENGGERKRETGDYSAVSPDLRHSRRSYLKVAGAALASVATVNAVSRGTDAAEYQTITIPAGTTKFIHVGDGETLENVLIDISAEGAKASIRTSGSGWTIRNVGFKGTYSGGGDSANWLLIPGVSDPDGVGVIENFYMGDGQVSGTRKGGIWVNANMPHRGTIVFRNVHIANMVSGLYASGPGYKGAGGNIRVEDSYVKSNYSSNIRTNGLKRTNVVKNTVVHIDGTQPACGPDTGSGGCSQPGSTNARAIWAWYGRCHLDNCDIVGPIIERDGGEVTMTNTRVGDDADTTPPAGVPMSAEEAASGTSGTDSSSDLSNTLSISGGSASTSTNYSFTVSEEIEKSTDRNASIDDEDTIDNGTVEGLVAGGTDSYRFSGDVSEFSIDGEATVYLNGSVIDPSTLSGSDTTADETLSNSVVIDGSASKGSSYYTFTVENGDVTKDSELGSINPFDSISDGTVTGRVIGGVDGYRFSGDVTEFHLRGSATVQFEYGSDASN